MERLLYINGLWQPAESNEWFEVDNPATEEIIARVARGDAFDVAQAVDAAKHAFEQWRWVSANARAEMLHEVAQLTRNHFDELVALLIEEEGKPRSENAEEMEWVATTF